MSFHVNPPALRTYGEKLNDASLDSTAAVAYLLRYADLAFDQGGLLGWLQPAHEEFVAEVRREFQYLRGILDKSKDELDRAATHYETLDATSAARLEATIPVTWPSYGRR